MKARPIPTMIATGAILLGCVFSVGAGEPVQFKGSTSVELPKPKRPFDDNRRIRNTEPERPSLDGGFVAPPAVENSPLTSKKMREEMDKKRNWIFENPYENHYDNKTQEFMRAEKGTGLYDNRWMETKDEKSAVQKFMEEKDARRDARSADKDNKLPDRNVDREDDKVGRNDEVDREKKDDFLGSPRGTVDKGLFETSTKADPFRSGPLDKALDKNAFSENPFSSKRSLSTTVDKDEFKKQQIAHEKEFDNILQTRLGESGKLGSSSVGRLDTLSVGGGLGTLDLKPDGSRPGALSSARPAAAPTRATFTDGGPSIGSTRATFDNRGLGDSFGSISKAAPSFAPSAAAPVVNERPGFTPAPFSLPFPQRKF